MIIIYNNNQSFIVRAHRVDCIISALEMRAAGVGVGIVPRNRCRANKHSSLFSFGKFFFLKFHPPTGHAVRYFIEAYLYVYMYMYYYHGQVFAYIYI